MNGLKMETPSRTPIFSSSLQSFLSGRSLLKTEMPFSDQMMKTHLDGGYMEAGPGIFRSKNRWRCLRCNNDTQRLFASFPCAVCKKTCVYCRNCIMMGRVATCTPLYRWTGPEPGWKDTVSLEWDGHLSAGQKAASEAVQDAVTNGEDLLIWAVCGAGKTEVLFGGIELALKCGKRTCIATPRTDVVLELVPRLQKVFPSITVAALYGGSEDRDVFSPLTISTTHQLMRFEDAFDVVIVDEVDAFPYSFDRSLQWAVEKSAKEHAARIYLTATPSKHWQDECRYGKRNYIKIPARFHRKPLPVPQFAWCGNWRKSLEKGKLPRGVSGWTQKRVAAGKQALIFLPHIQLMEKSLPLFQQLHPAIQAVHAEDSSRKEKVKAMRKGEIPILLTTTILERGVTFPNIDVAIVGAEDDIFTEAALVQIAGRVGRSPEYPGGAVTFFHHGRTKAMIRALVHIAGMNNEARKAGLIDE